jgi:hypothetical protein
MNNYYYSANEDNMLSKLKVLLSQEDISTKKLLASPTKQPLTKQPSDKNKRINVILSDIDKLKIWQLLLNIVGIINNAKSR